MRKNPMHVPLSKRRFGFTLTEAAIVLGAVGIVMGAIWEVSQSVRNSQHLGRTVQQVAQVTQNIREYYMNAQGIPTACTSLASTDITAMLDGGTVPNAVGNGGLFLSEMRSSCSTCGGDAYKIDNPYVSAGSFGSGIGAGSFRVLGASSSCSGTTASRFQIVLTNLSPAACASLLYSGVNFKDQSMGITQVCAANEGTSSAIHPCYSGTGWTAISCSGGICDASTPITLSQAETLCGSTGTGEVGWEFKVRN